MLSAFLVPIKIGPGFWSRVPGVGPGFYSFPSVVSLLFVIPPMSGDDKIRNWLIKILDKRTTKQSLENSVYFEYEENFTHDRLLSLNYAFCHIKRLIKTSEPVYTD